jgi:hypothetical protein
MVCGHAIRGVGHSGNKEGRIAHLAEIARRDEQRYEQNRTEPVNPAGWRELHKSPVPVRNCVTASPTVRARPLFAVPGPERTAIPQRAESGRQLRQCRKKDLRNLRRAQELAPVIRVSPARCLCPFRRL